MKDFIFDSLPTLNSNPDKNGFLAACSSTSADMPRACESFMKITRQFQNNFPQPAAAFGVFSRKLSQITRKLAFSLPHRRLSNADASITLPSARARFFENYSCPSASVRSEKKFTIKFTGNLRTFTFREATKPFGTNRAAKTERNINNYRNAPLAIFRNNNTPWRIPHGRSETARAIRMISGRGAAALGLLCTFLSERIPWTGCRKCFAARRRTAVLIGCGRGFCLQASLQGKDKGVGYRQQNRVIVE